MKYLYKFLMIAIAIGFVTSCNESENPWTGDALSGGLVIPVSASNNYVVGNNATYNVPFEVQQGNNTTSAVEVYKSFYSVADETWSNEVLESTIAISNNKTHVNSDFSIDYAGLTNGLLVNGNPIPADDGQLTIGDFWNFRLVSTVSNGSSVESNQKVKLAVSTRFAGNYDVIESAYLHPTAGDQGGWNGQLRVIESIDAVTYKMTDIGPWVGEPTNFFFFTVDASDVIDVPKEYKGSTQLIWGADDIAICAAGETPNVVAKYGGCGNKVTRDDVDGHDQIEIAYGYIRSSGTREFFERIVKQ